MLNKQTVGCYPSGVGASVKAPGRRDMIGGVYIVDRDTAVADREKLREFYDRLYPGGALPINEVNVVADMWNWFEDKLLRTKG